MVLLTFILGITDLVLLVVVLKYGHRLENLEDVDNPKKWERQHEWNTYVSKKIDMMFRKLGMFPYDGNYVYLSTLEAIPELNPPHEPLPVLEDTEKQS